MSESSKAGALGIGMSAALGGLAAVIMDLFQKKDASAIYQLTNVVNKTVASFDPTGAFALPVGGVGLLLMIGAIILAFVSEAQSKRAAFYAGASVLTVLMALVPYQQPLAPSTGTTVRQMSDAQPLGRSYVPAAYLGSDVKTMVNRGGRLWAAQAGPEIPVVVMVHTEGGQPARISGVLYDTVSGRSYQLGYGAPAGQTGGGSTYRFEFAIEAGHPKGNIVADLKLRVEASGYKTTTVAQTVTTAGAPVQIEVSLAPSKVPQFLQRALERPQF